MVSIFHIARSICEFYNYCKLNIFLFQFTHPYIYIIDFLLRISSFISLKYKKINILKKLFISDIFSEHLKKFNIYIVNYNDITFQNINNHTLLFS